MIAQRFRSPTEVSIDLFRFELAISQMLVKLTFPLQLSRPKQEVRAVGLQAWRHTRFISSKAQSIFVESKRTAELVILSLSLA